MAYLKEAAERCLRRELGAMVTAPVSKENIIRADIPRWATVIRDAGIAPQ